MDARRLAAATLLAAGATCGAGEVTVVDAVLTPNADHEWHASVTLRHADSGWDHYADAWRVITPDGDVLGVRTLFHPHVEEQPFTRSLTGLPIPGGVRRVFVEAHDTVHGWSGDRLEVLLPVDR